MAHSLLDLSGGTTAVVGGTSGVDLAMTVGLAESGAFVATSRGRQQFDDAAIIGPRV